MNKDEMIKDMGTAISKAWGLKYEGGLLVKELANLGYRKVGKDEIVESMKTYERARQETAREIIATIIDDNGADLNKIAQKYDIETEWIET